MTFNPPKEDIFTEEFWKRPDPCEKGDPDVEMIYRAVGYTTSQWERLEQSMAHLFLGITGASGPNYKSIGRAYGSIFGNAGRREALRNAAEAHFDNFWQ